MKRGKSILAAGLAVFLIPMIFCATVPRAEEYQESGDKDYFHVVDPRDKTLLYNVEKHHLAQDNFWKWAQAGKYNLALEELKFVLRYFPNHPEALSLIGMIGKTTKNLSLPIPYYEKALELYPQYALTHAQYGIYLTEIGLPRDGIAHLNTAVELGPKLGIAHAGLAKAYERAGEKDLARKSAEQARDLGYRGSLTEGILDGKAEKGKK